MGSRSEVSKFAVLAPSSVNDAIGMLTKYGPDQARIISGGTDIITRNKNRIATHMSPYLVDISNLGLSYMKYSSSDGFRIGGTTKINDVAVDSNVNSNAAVLAQAAAAVATLQLRNNGTIAGDILQEVWCPYLRNDYPCWRNGGNVCYGAIGDNRYYHSIFGGRLCYANSAGDIPPALFALNAEATVQGPLGSRTVSMDQLMPGISVIGGRVQENSVAYNEILTEVHIPSPASGTKSSFAKMRDRGTWDFALASAAVVVNTSGGSVSNAKVVLGGVDVIPHRAHGAENALNGKQLSESNIQGAASAAVADANPLNYGTGNAYRVELAKAAVMQALRAVQ